jgi:hypothetical protein
MHRSAQMGILFVVAGYAERSNKMASYTVDKNACVFKASGGSCIAVERQYHR